MSLWTAVFLCAEEVVDRGRSLWALMATGSDVGDRGSEGGWMVMGMGVGLRRV